MDTLEKLFNIQQRLKAGKDQYNSFGKYSYRSCESILEALKPLLEDYSAVVVFSDAIENVGNRNYVTTTLKFIDVENPSNIIEVTASAREEESKKGMDGSQITGASSSYARKYALNAMFAIDDNKDSDVTNTGNSNPKEAVPYERKEEQTTPSEPNWRQECIDKYKSIGKNASDLARVYAVDKNTTNEEWKKIWEDISEKIGRGEL